MTVAPGALAAPSIRRARGAGLTRGRQAAALIGILGLVAILAAPALADPLRPAAKGKNAGVALPALAYPPSPPRLTPDDAMPGAREAADEPPVKRICRLIAENADAVGMPRSFFARLIWKESRFDAKARSPVGAQGIAQFMPYTAAERGLDDPFDTAEAIRHSALFLADLRSELGNWGLAAAAYNGGPNRVKRWIANGGQLPYETENYVVAITARPALWFTEDGREIEARPLEDGKEFDESCERLPIIESRSVFAALETGAPMKPWGVQIAGNPSPSVAMAMFRRVQAKMPNLLGGKAPLVLRERAPGLGRIWAVRIGADSRGEANQFCVRLKKAGGSCIVIKNR